MQPLLSTRLRHRHLAPPSPRKLQRMLPQHWGGSGGIGEVLGDSVPCRFDQEAAASACGAVCVEAAAAGLCCFASRLCPLCMVLLLARRAPPLMPPHRRAATAAAVLWLHELLSFMVLLVSVQVLGS